MSSNHTYVTNSEWEAMQSRIACSEAYIINRRSEAERIAQIASQRRQEAQIRHSVNQQLAQDSIRALRAEFNRMCGQNSRISSEISERKEQFDRELDDIQSTLSDANRRLDSLDRTVESMAEAFSETFHMLNAQSATKEERARRIAEETDRLCSQIEELNPDRFAPGEYASLISLRASADAAVNSGDFQAAVVMSQNSILTASRLLARLIVLNEKYDDLYRETSDFATRLNGRIESLNSDYGVLSFEFDGRSQEADYDIAFWSNGRFDEIRREFERYDRILRENDPSVEQLHEIGQRLNDLDEQLTRCDRSARRERAGALAAADMAIRLNNSLSNSGWQLADSGYKQDDERNPYMMSYDDNAGNNVSIVVAPENPESPSFFIEVFSDDPYSAAMTKEGVYTVLENDGLNISQIEQRNDCHLNPNPETFIENATGEAMERLNARRSAQRNKG